MCIYAMMYIEKHSDLFFIFNTMCVDNYVHSEQDKVRSASVTCGCYGACENCIKSDT